MRGFLFFLGWFTGLNLCVLLGLSSCSFATTSHDGREPGIVAIQVRQKTLVVKTRGAGKQVKLIELRPYQRYRPAADFPVVWKGKLTGNTIKIARFDNKKDRMFSKFQLVHPTTLQAYGPARWVTDTSALPRRDFDFPWPKDNIKGLSCVVMVDDAIKLGVKYVTDNIWFSQAFDWSDNPKEFWEVDGEKIPINTAYFERMDRKVKALTDAGINVTMVLNNTLPRNVDKNSPILHPNTDPSKAPRFFSAINVATEKGLLYFRGLMEYVAQRYSHPDGKHGWISGYIVGNEVQSHWEWYNMGEIQKDELIENYLWALRVADLAVRKIHSKIRIYISMDHFWNIMMDTDKPLRYIRGKELLEDINEASKAEGNFPWHVAFHPYPEDLFKPQSWLDETATYSFDTPKITFKNIEVLPAFLQQERFLYNGKQRHIILSEQGFHRPEGPDGEKLQAAGFAYGYYRVSHTPGIDAFMLHRHVDCRDEGGLRLGIWTWDNPPKKKYIYDVFRLADTNRWEEAFEFAKPIIGIQKWDELRPQSITKPR